MRPWSAVGGSAQPIGVHADAGGRPGAPANEIVVPGACTFDGPVEDRRVTAVDLHVLGRVPGLDLAGFRETVTAVRPASLRAAGFRDDVPGELEVEIAPSS